VLSEGSQIHKKPKGSPEGADVPQATAHWAESDMGVWLGLALRLTSLGGSEDTHEDNNGRVNRFNAVMKDNDSIATIGVIQSCGNAGLSQPARPH
jgi:hypothetical protein